MRCGGAVGFWTKKNPHLSVRASSVSAIFYYAFQFAVSAVWTTKAIQPNAPIFTRTSNMWFLLSSRYIYILP
jgi:hypothetical protein